MATEYKLPYSGSEINRRLRDVDTKAIVMSLTSAEYEALEETNANTIYMLTDSDEDSAHMVVTIDGDTASHSFSEIKARVESGATVMAQVNSLESEVCSLYRLNDLDNNKRIAVFTGVTYTEALCNLLIHDDKTYELLYTTLATNADVSSTIKYTEQKLTEEQQTQARANIGITGTGADGKDGTSVTVKSISESTADGGSNVVTFSDGKTVTIKNGSNGKDGKDGLDATPVAPLFANSIEECTDTSKFYVLPDGFIYAYMLKETTGGIAYTNQVPISTDTDGSIYNGTGYKDNTRLSSSGGVSSTAQTGSVVTGFMPWQSNGVIRIKGATFPYDTAKHYYVNFYDASKSFIYGGNDDTINQGSGVWETISVSVDETTGVTTIDFSNCTTSDIGNAATNAVYFRINAYGTGANLIVTVNEEIKEAGSTVSYQWTNTGHAFVPADYEDRIVEVETKATTNASDISSLKQQVNGILDGSSSIMASTKFDPTVYRLPILYLTGDTTGMTKENAVTLSYQCKDKDGNNKTGSNTLKWQGSSSLAWDKKNYTIKFDQAIEFVDGWGAQSKYCLKANWIDHSHSRNVVCAKLWGLIRKNRSNLNSRLAALPNAGAIDGFPVIIMLNDEFHGLYSFNIPKDKWMFGMGSGANEAIVTADNQATDTAFKGETLLDADGLELEYNSDGFSADDVKNSFNTLINACINSDGSDLDTTVAQYLDWESAIDYYIFCVIIKGGDMIQKNAIYATFDGVKWYFSAYDMDTTFGLAFDGSALDRAVSNVTFAEAAENHRVFELIKNYKTSELKARYNALRANALSETRICQYFENYLWDVSTPILLEDVKKWASVRGSAVNGIDQICRWIRQRLEVTDVWANAL